MISYFLLSDARGKKYALEQQQISARTIWNSRAYLQPVSYIKVWEFRIKYRILSFHDHLLQFLWFKISQKNREKFKVLFSYLNFVFLSQGFWHVFLFQILYFDSTFYKKVLFSYLLKFQVSCWWRCLWCPKEVLAYKFSRSTNSFGSLRWFWCPAGPRIWA